MSFERHTLTGPTMTLRLLAFIAALGITTSSLRAGDPDYTRDVQPILAKNCLSCHGPEKRKGGLRLDRRSTALKGGDSGAVIVPGKPSESLLLKKIASKDDDERMPPTGKPLSAEQIRILTDWIAAGANWPSETTE